MIVRRLFWFCLIVCTIVLGHSRHSAGGTGTSKPTIVVFDFNVGETVSGKVVIRTGAVGSQVASLGDYQTSLLTEKLVTALVASKKVSVVERKKLDTMMEEMNLTKADLTDPQKSVNFGKLLAGDYLMHGSLSMLDGTIAYETLPYNMGKQRVTELLVGADIRIVDTETGKIVCAKSEKVKSIKRETNPPSGGNDISIEFQHELYDELVQRLVARVIDTLFPIKVAYFSNNIVYMNRGGLKEGTKYEVVILGEEIRDPDSGEVLGQAESKLAIVQVTRALEKLSQAEIIESFTTEKTIPSGSLCRVFLPEETGDSEKSPPKPKKSLD
ncbi:MAG: hypothetical protein A2Z25_01320 [Planctomycetes bacterium RBG_16_55_9]|nr:MAG: hypothetical protein A2Z25_01320 [Planctomycetes bacterium RBG_16_55_9]